MKIKIGKLSISFEWGNPIDNFQKEYAKRLTQLEAMKKIKDAIEESMEPPYIKQVKDYLRKGEKLMAVKAYRDATGETLLESKRVVLNMYDKMIIDAKK
jgi:ribosomal protein L7/L12